MQRILPILLLVAISSFGARAIAGSACCELTAPVEVTSCEKSCCTSAECSCDSDTVEASHCPCHIQGDPLTSPVVPGNVTLRPDTGKAALLRFYAIDVTRLFANSSHKLAAGCEAGVPSTGLFLLYRSIRT